MLFDRPTYTPAYPLNSNVMMSNKLELDIDTFQDMAQVFAYFEGVSPLALVNFAKT